MAELGGFYEHMFGRRSVLDSLVQQEEESLLKGTVAKLRGTSFDLGMFTLTSEV
jgi:hypothetical protein